jgi:hypothetical protein
MVKGALCHEDLAYVEKVSLKENGITLKSCGEYIESLGK